MTSSYQDGSFFDLEIEKVGRFINQQKTCTQNKTKGAASMHNRASSGLILHRISCICTKHFHIGGKVDVQGFLKHN